MKYFIDNLKCFADYSNKQVGDPSNQRGTTPPTSPPTFPPKDLKQPIVLEDTPPGKGVGKEASTSFKEAIGGNEQYILASRNDRLESG